MSLLSRAAQEAQKIVSKQADFGQPVTIQAPDDSVQNVVGIINDVAQVYDPVTGIVVSGETATATVSLADLTTVPKQVNKATWTANGRKILAVYTDKVLGLVTLQLEVNKNG